MDSELFTAAISIAVNNIIAANNSMQLATNCSQSSVHYQTSSFQSIFAPSISAEQYFQRFAILFYIVSCLIYENLL